MRENEWEGEKRGGGEEEKRGRNLLLGSIRASRRNTVWGEIFAAQNFRGFRGFASDRENFNREIL